MRDDCITIALGLPEVRVVREEETEEDYRAYLEELLKGYGEDVRKQILSKAGVIKKKKGKGPTPTKPVPPGWTLGPGGIAIPPKPGPRITPTPRRPF